MVPNRIQLLREMAVINYSRTNNEILEDYQKLKGFGKWTTGAVSILLDLDDSVNLSSDAYIRKIISLYAGIKMNEKQCYQYINKFGNQQTKICYFLWRIRVQSINKVKLNLELTKEDFI